MEVEGTFLRPASQLADTNREDLENLSIDGQEVSGRWPYPHVLASFRNERWVKCTTTNELLPIKTEILQRANVCMVRVAGRAVRMITQVPRAAKPLVRCESDL